MNYIQDHKSVKDHLVENIDSIYSYNLKLLLHDERQHMNGEFNYTFHDERTTGKKLVVNFTADLKDVFLDRTGIKFDWSSKIKDDKDWKWYNHTIGLPFDIK